MMLKLSSSAGPVPPNNPTVSFQTVRSRPFTANTLASSVTYPRASLLSPVVSLPYRSFHRAI